MQPKKKKKQNKTKNKKKKIVMIIFFWGLCCQCPCPPSEPQPTPASPGGPLIPLGRSLDSVWALWGQLRHWPGPTPVCTCPQSPQLLKLGWSQLWEYSLSIQIFYRCRVYQADHGDLASPLCVGHPQASVPHLGKRGWKQWLIGSLRLIGTLIQAMEG